MRASHLKAHPHVMLATSVPTDGTRMNNRSARLGELVHAEGGRGCGACACAALALLSAYLARAVEHDQPVLLPADRHRLDVTAADSAQGLSR
jgi:hypothetical protein